MSGATFDPPPGGSPPRPPFTGGLPNTVGAQVDNSGLINSAVLLMIQAWNENTAQLSALLNTVGGTITGDVSGNLPGPVQVTATHLAAPLPIAQGGTGNALGQALPTGAAGGGLSGTFPNPSVTSTTLSAPLPVAQGGTGISSGTSGGILGFTAVGVVGSSGLLAASQLVVGGGAGVLPSTIGSLGTVNTILHGNAAGLPGYGPVATADISNSAVTFQKVQNVATVALLGNPTGAGAAPSEITLGATLGFVGTALQTAAITGDVTAAANSHVTTVAQIAGNPVAVNAWVPALAFGGSTAGVTYAVQTGSYVQLGKLVVALFSITLTNKGAAPGAATIGGLPFTVGALSGTAEIGTHAAMATTNDFECTAPNGGTSISLGKSGAVAWAALADTDFNNTTSLSGTAIFIAA